MGHSQRVESCHRPLHSGGSFPSPFLFSSCKQQQRKQKQIETVGIFLRTLLALHCIAPSRLNQSSG